MLHYNSLRRYTLALLSTFNDIEIEYLLSDGITKQRKKIPIVFSSREKSKLFNEHETSQLLSGNTNVLPRISLVFTSMIKSDTRSTNKFTKHNVQDVGNNNMSFNYNAVSYEFMYELVIQCRGMNEASMIVEQIATRFNPNYSIRINEVPGVQEATTVPISLLDISIESEEYDDISSNIVDVSCGLSLKGNLYPKLKEMPGITNYKMYSSIYENNEFSRNVLQEWDVVGSIVNGASEIRTEFQGTVVPIVNDIIGSFVVGISEVQSVYVDKYNKPEELIFIWSVISGDAVITTGKETATLNVYSGTTVQIQLQIVDVHGNSSNVFNKIL